MLGDVGRYAKTAGAFSALAVLSAPLCALAAQPAGYVPGHPFTEDDGAPMHTGPVVDRLRDIPTPAPVNGSQGSLTSSIGFDGDGLTGMRTREVWREDEGRIDRLRVTVAGPLRGQGGAPWVVGDPNQAELDAQAYDISYTRGWPVRYQGETMDVELIPHAGVGATSDGGSVEAGATIRIGETQVVDGRRYGDEGRWYLFAAGSGRAVGMNWRRNLNGGWSRDGMSHDAGAYIGDAQVGVAWRRGDVQASFGYVHREIEAEGLAGEGFDRDRTEGLLAFQISIKPQ
ncbi:DUF2219 family protein [Brevundimonas sp. 2R-24]|uniref:DUF2219 family protein n=1 Tax=Peiella sedimenti TaxID=3061083 RepID=A0ABT8SK43_9CAUL|nr:DUF2219 family protein [Caulobacteraceae bacterium XZ-24]